MAFKIEDLLVNLVSENKQIAEAAIRVTRLLDCGQTGCDATNCGRTNCNGTDCGTTVCLHTDCVRTSCGSTGCGDTMCGQTLCSDTYCRLTGCVDTMCGKTGCDVTAVTQVCRPADESEVFDPVPELNLLRAQLGGILNRVMFTPRPESSAGRPRVTEVPLKDIVELTIKLRDAMDKFVRSVSSQKKRRAR